MNYSELQIIIKHLKKAVSCNNCKKKFAPEGLEIVSTFKSEALLHLNCFNCHNEILVHVAIVSNQEKSTLNIRTHKPGEISQNEILDMHNFLNQFNGDFKELFTK